MRRLGRRIVIGLVWGASVLGGPTVAPRAQASVSIAIPFDDLVRESVAAVIVTPTTARTVWEEGRIITYTEAHVDALVAGGVAGATAIWVRTRGGNLGHTGQAVEGEAVLTVGRPTLLFVRAPNDHAATPYVVTARAQGQFPLAVDAQGTRRVYASDAVGLLLPRAGLASAGALPHPLAAVALHGQTVEDARGAIARAWGPGHGP